MKIEINDQASLNSTSNRSRKSSADGNLGFNYDIGGVVGADINGKGNIDLNTSSVGQGSTQRSEKIEMSVAAIVTRFCPTDF